MLKITSSIVKTKNFNRIRYLYEAQTKKCLRFKSAELKLVQRVVFKYYVVELRAADSKIDLTARLKPDTYIFGSQIKLRC